MKFVRSLNHIDYSLENETGRLGVINEAFDKLDVTGDGRLTVDDLKGNLHILNGV